MRGTRSLNQLDPVVGVVSDTAPVFDAGDLARETRPGFLDGVRSACRDPGFFYVDLAPDQQRDIDQTLAVMQDFFSLPDNDPRKQRVRQSPDGTGWIPRYTEPAYQPGTRSSLEAFDVSLEDVSGTAVRDIWPDVPGFREAATRCWGSCIGLADQLLDVIGLAAGMQPGFLPGCCNTRQLNTLRLLHYAAVPATPDRRNVGIAAHTDFECITLIYQTAPGLELADSSGQWLDAPASGGRVVVLLDDMLEHWTNGTVRATGHRVRETPNPRFSIVMFVAADPGVLVQPLPEFVSTGMPPRFSPVSQELHIENEMRRARENVSTAGIDTNLANFPGTPV